MKHPLVAVALCYAAGIVMVDQFELPLAAMVVWALVVGGVALAWERGSRWLLGLLLVLAGAINGTLATAILSPLDLRVLMGDEPRLATVRGRLCETPIERVYEQDEQESWRTTAFVEVKWVQFGQGSWERAVGRIMVRTPDKLGDEYFGGQAVQVYGVLGPPPRASAPGLFDYQAYLRRRGVYYQLQTRGSNDWQIFESGRRFHRPWSDRFTHWARETLARGLPERDETFELLCAMALGMRTGLSGEVAVPFMRSGTMHVFAISGLHVALVAGILMAVLRLVRVPRTACSLVVIPLLWGYTAATGWQASSVRATVMMSLVLGGWLLQRPTDLLNSLAAAALLILLWDPRQLFQAGFQLSFCVVLSLAVFGPALRQIQRRLLAPDPLLPLELRPWWQRWLLAWADWLARGLTTSLAAWVGSAPLIATYFHLFTPVNLLANLVVVPLAGAALASSLGSLVTGTWWPSCTELFNHSAWLWMSLVKWASEWAAELPGAWYWVPSPGLVGLALYYGTLASVLAGWLRKPRVRVWTWAALGGLATLWLAEQLWHRAATRLTILPLDGGQALFLSGKGSQGGWLIDCGDQRSVERVTGPFLTAWGVTRVSGLVLTHGDARHVGGAQTLLKRIAVDQIVINPVPFRSASYRSFLERYDNPPSRLRSVCRGQTAGPWTVLHPGLEEPFRRADDNATVLWGQWAGFGLLLMSDLGKAGQNRLLEHLKDREIDIVVSGLPDQSEPLDETLLDRVKPQLIIIVDSARPAPARAGWRLRARLARRAVPVLYTSDTGAMTLELRRGEWRLEAVSGLRLRGP
jgi:ComEC/Rec2-related protein